jgi:hypothetical protein
MIFSLNQQTKKNHQSCRVIFLTKNFLCIILAFFVTFGCFLLQRFSANKCNTYPLGHIFWPPEGAKNHGHKFGKLTVLNGGFVGQTAISVSFCKPDHLDEFSGVFMHFIKSF